MMSYDVMQYGRKLIYDDLCTQIKYFIVILTKFMISNIQSLPSFNIKPEDQILLNDRISPA